VLLKAIYGASGEYSPSLAIGSITHSALSLLSHSEAAIVGSLPAVDDPHVLEGLIFEAWSEAVDPMIEREWRFFADAGMSTVEGRQAVLEKLRGFATNLGEEVAQGRYRSPDDIIANHSIVLPSIPLQGVPDEYRVYNGIGGVEIEVREFKAFGGSKVNEGNKLQVCAYQVLLERIYPDATFSLKVISTDDVVNVRFTDKRRKALLEGIKLVKNVFETTRARARAIPGLCGICHVREACEFYFEDPIPTNIRRYFWRLRMETLEEKALNQTWKWVCNVASLDERKALGRADDNYDLVEAIDNTLVLRKASGVVENVLKGDTVIVSSGNPLTDLSVTGEISGISGDRVRMTCYTVAPPMLPHHGLVIDQYDVDLTRRELSNVDAAHRAGGRAAELINVVLGLRAPRPLVGTPEVTPSLPLNPSQEEALGRALTAPDVFVVIGPPGTGKTTVISELLVELASSGKRVLVVSITNGAVDNIVEALLKRGDNIGVRFGNWYKIREAAMDAALIRLIDGKQDKALAAVGLMRQAGVVLTTCSSSCLDLVKAAPFDVVIFEEASQVRMQSAFIPITRAKRVIIFGDDKQLPPVSQLHRQPDSLLKIALESIRRNGLSSSLVTQLDVQYRMKNKICTVVNELFYGRSLKTDERAESRSLPYPLPQPIPEWIGKVLDPAVEVSVVNVESVEEPRGNSLFNRISARVDELLVKTLNASGLGGEHIGLITPYKEQQRLLATRIGTEAEIGTIDAYQGRERDIIILDLVRANPNYQLGFTLQPNRLNVALSRARQKLIIVMNCQTFSKDKVFQQLIEIVRSNGPIVEVRAKDLGMSLPRFRAREDVEVRVDLLGKDTIDMSERRVSDAEYAELI
jgi:CRISPR/Cas system-associated exonuclease Cas4 (RecB family)